MQMVQAQINAVTAFPLKGTALNPDLVGISVQTTLTFVPGATAAQKQAATDLPTDHVPSWPRNIYVLARGRAAPTRPLRVSQYRGQEPSASRCQFPHASRAVYPAPAGGLIRVG
jgi:hypothetical protein